MHTRPVAPLRSFAAARSGATAMIYAIVLIPVLAGAGMALDFSRINTGQAAISDAVDAAVLAATRELSDATRNDADITATAVDFYHADLISVGVNLTCPDPVITIDRAANSVQIDADCDLPSTMTSILGVDQFDLRASGNATAAITYLDLALILDVSGSMAGTKLTDLQTAAKSAINTLITPKTGDRVRISVVPYSEAINIGAYNADAFMSDPGHDCATERAGAEAETAAAPGPLAWMGTASTTCPGAEILPLTNNVTALETHIDSLNASGGTAGHLGAAWAWYTISPNWSSIWPTASAPRPMSTPNVIKAAILMTDGAFNAEYETAMGTSDDQARALCTAMKANDVKVFTVAFLAPPSGEAVLQFCADDTDAYFDASSGADLTAAYESIASTLKALRLTS